MRFTVSSLEIEIQSRDTTINQLRNEVRQSQILSHDMVYTEEEYSRIKEESFRLQRELTNIRGQIVDKDFTISQLEQQLQFNTRSYQD